MNNAPAFQHYVSEFLSHPIVALMTTEEIGALWLLINYAWKLGELPNDIEELSIYARLPIEKFETMWTRRIQRCFQMSDHNTWTHPHLENEKIKHQNIREVRQKASASRWDKQSKTILDANAMQMQSSSSSTSSVSSTSQEKEETNVSSKKMKKGCRIPDDFYPSAETIKWTLEVLPDIDLEMRVKEFKNYWTAKTGKDATKHDWDKTFENRILQIKDYAGKQNGNSNGRLYQQAQNASTEQKNKRLDAIFDDAERFKAPIAN